MRTVFIFGAGVVVGAAGGVYATSGSSIKFLGKAAYHLRGVFIKPVRFVLSLVH